MKGVKFLFIFLLLILLINPVNADIFFYTTKTSSKALCPRESGLYIDTIKNIDNIERQYNLKLTGNAAEWSTSLPNNFILKSGESKDLYTYLTPTQNTQVGNYGINIEITSNDITKVIKHFVEVKDCYKIEVSSSVQSISTCPSQAQSYNINVINKGEVQETYTISIDDNLIKDKIKLSDTTFSLGINQQKIIYLFVTAPQDSLEYKFNVIIKGTRTKVEYPLILNVLPCYDFKFNSEGNKEYNVCDRTITVVSYRLENSGTTTNDYEIKLDGPEWIRIENKEYNLLPSESKIVNIAFAPDYGINSSYEVKVMALPKRGNAKIVNNFNVNVRRCNDLKLEVLQDNVKTCKTVNNGYNINVKNIGEVQKIVKIIIDGPEWFNLQGDSQIVLKANESKLLNLNANPPDNVKNGNYNIKIKLIANDESSIVANDEKTLNLEVVDLKGCYQGIISTLYDNFVVYYDSNIGIPVTIKNDGLKKADYKLSLTGNATNFISLNPNTLSLEPGKEETIYLYAAPGISTVLGKYDALLSVNLNEGQLIGSRTFNIEITDNINKTTSLNQTQIVLNKTGFFAKSKEFLNKYKLQLISAGLLIILLILAGILGLYNKLIDFFEDEEITEEKIVVKESDKEPVKKIKNKKDKKNEEIKDNVGE